MPAAKKKDMIMKLKDTTDNHVPPGIALLINLPTSTPKHIPEMMPMIPPAILMTTDSIRNCTRISRLLAPIDFRKPISLVRSVTETKELQKNKCYNFTPRFLSSEFPSQGLTSISSSKEIFYLLSLDIKGIV